MSVVISDSVTHCATLLDHNFWKETTLYFNKLYLIWLFMSINMSQHGGVPYHLKFSDTELSALYTDLPPTLSIPALCFLMLDMISIILLVYPDLFSSLFMLLYSAFYTKKSSHLQLYKIDSSSIGTCIEKWQGPVFCLHHWVIFKIQPAVVFSFEMISSWLIPGVSKTGKK